MSHPTCFGVVMNSAKDLLCILLTSGFLFLTAPANADTPKPIAASVKSSLDAKLQSGMRITTMKLDNKRININGTSPTNALVSQFLRNLVNSPSYTKVELVSIAQQNNTMQFHIVADVQCPNTGGKASGENLCDASSVKPASIFKCTQGGKTIFQDRPCAASK
jgi:hypothetical protein